MNNFSWLCVKLELQHNVIPAMITDTLLILKYKGKFPAFAPLEIFCHICSYLFTDVSGSLSVQPSRVKQTTNICCITSQKNEGLTYTMAEA